MPSVLIVDDHLLIRFGLRQMLCQERRGFVFGEAQTSEEAETWLRKRHWDLVILAIALPGGDGFSVLEEIRRRSGSTRTLVLGAYSDPQHAIRARRGGASGYVCKNAGRADLLRAVNSVLAGEEYFQGPLSRRTVTQEKPRRSRLSGRERGVMLAVAAGKRTGEIAAELQLSIKTVSTYKRRLLDKLQLHSTAELVRYAIDRHLS